MVVVCWFLFSTRLTETQHNGMSTQLLPLSSSEYTGFLNIVLQDFKLLLYTSLVLLSGKRVFMFCTMHYTILSTCLIISTELWLGICNISCRPAPAPNFKGSIYSLVYVGHYQAHIHTNVSGYKLPKEALVHYNMEITRHTRVSSRGCLLHGLCGVLFACVCVHFIFSNLCNSFIYFPFV